MARFARHRSSQKLDQNAPRSLPSVARAVSLLVSADCLLDDLDFLVGHPVQLVHDLVDQLVGALDLPIEVRGALPRVDVPL